MRTNLFSSSAAVLVAASAAAALSSAALRGVAHGAAQAVPADPVRASHMRVHFSEVMTVHEAVIRGDLAAVKAPAVRLAGHDAPASLPAAAAPYLAEMRRAAGRTAEASTILDAALGTADMLKTCGDCHRGLGTMPAVAQGAEADVGGSVGHMHEHQRSVDQMLQGLIVPSTAAWRAGADGLGGAALHRKALPNDHELTPEVLASETRIHQLAAQAGRSEAPGARSVFYGQIIARCADCHALHSHVWGPARR